MKKLCVSLAVLVFLLSSTQLISQFFEIGETPVGLQPVGIFGTEYGIIAICAGIDKNFNGVFEPDSGDVLPSFWGGTERIITVIPNDGISSLTNYLKYRDLDFGYLGFPFRPAFSSEDGEIYFSQNGKIKSYKIDDASLIDSSVANISADALSILGDRMYISIKKYGVKDSVIVYDYKQKIFLDTIPAYKNVQQTLPFTLNQKNYLAILNEGTFGASDSKLQIIDLTDYKELAVLDIGSLGNHLAYDGYQTLAVTMNGSHEVQLIDLATMTIKKTIKLPTTGYNGPRETAFDKRGRGKLYTTAYDSKLYVLNEKDGLVEKSYNLYGKGEGITTLSSGSMVATNIFFNNSYTADSTLTLFSDPTDVEDANSYSNIKLYPNPANDFLTLNIGNCIPGEDLRLQIFSIEGSEVYNQNIIAESENTSHRVNLQALGLSIGRYFAKVQRRAVTEIIPFSIIR